MRIVSLLPSATDIVVALGAGAELVGVSHSCSGEWAHLPRLTSTWIDKHAAAADIDEAVRTANRPLYALDIAMLETLAPDVIISQSLCDVCAVPSGDVLGAVGQLSSRPVLVDLAPHTLGDVPLCFDQVGDAINRAAAAKQLKHDWDALFADFAGRFTAYELTALFLDWLDPPFVAGHWIPEMLAHVGMAPLLGRAGKPSFRSDWDTIAAARPDLVIVAACGLDEERAKADGVPVDCPVIFLDGHLHFSRPGPALMPSLALLSDAIARHLVEKERQAATEGTAVKAQGWHAFSFNRTASAIYG